MATPNKRVMDLFQYATSLDPAMVQQIAAKQQISETKYDTIAFAAGAITPATPFFANQSSDLAFKNFDGNGYLVGQGKWFLAQTIGVNVIDVGATTTGLEVLAVLNKCAIRLQVDTKIMGTFPLHQLTGFGGAFVPSQIAVAAAAAPAGAIANAGITNGQPQNLPFKLTPMLLEGQKPFVATLIGPTGTPISTTGGITLKVCVGGLQFQSIQ